MRPLIRLRETPTGRVDLHRTVQLLSVDPTSLTVRGHAHCDQGSSADDPCGPTTTQRTGGVPRRVPGPMVTGPCGFPTLTDLSGGQLHHALIAWHQDVHQLRMSRSALRGGFQLQGTEQQLVGGRRVALGVET